MPTTNYAQNIQDNSLYKTARRYLRKFGLESKLADNIIIIDMLEYYTFISTMVGAKAVITDGGSIQEECAYLDKPCLIIRNNTERSDGIGANALLWKFDKQVTEQFKELIKAYIPALSHEWPHPSDNIVTTLLKAI